MFPNKNFFGLAISFIILLMLSSSGFAKECGKLPRFEDFPVTEIFIGKPAPPQLVTEDLKRFRTNIREGAKEPANFAGHYTVFTIGCGTNCGALYIVDAKSGRVFTPGADIIGSVQPDLGFQDQYRLDSRLLIGFDHSYALSHPSTGDELIPDDALFYEWKNNELRLICTKRPTIGAQREDKEVLRAAEGSYTPEKDSKERKAIMDALRAVVKNMSGLDIIFVVDYLKVKNDWAWAETKPQSPDGSQHYEDVIGLLHKEKGRWIYVEGPPELGVCESDPDCADSSRYFKNLVKKYPSLPPEILPR